jgi:acyl-CoA thioesterase FadM
MRLVLDTAKLGNSSATLRYRGFNGDATEPSVEAHGTIVAIDLDTFQVMPFPDDIRTILEELRD